MFKHGGGDDVAAIGAGAKTLSMVEYMHADALDAKVDFFKSEMWRFEKGPSFPGVLKKTVSEWRLMSFWPDLDCPGEGFQPLADFPHWQAFKDLVKAHEGEVRLVDDGSWESREGQPPLDLSYWHCQYALDTEQRLRAEKLGCRGAPGHGKRDWESQPQLTPRQMWTIGSTSVCQLRVAGPGEPGSHWRRCGIMLSYPRFLTFLLKVVGPVDMYTAENWWRSKQIICKHKARQVINGVGPKGSKGAKGSKGKGRGSKGYDSHHQGSKDRYSKGSEGSESKKSKGAKGQKGR
jgi:hypothetical protein